MKAACYLISCCSELVGHGWHSRQHIPPKRGCPASPGRCKNVAFRESRGKKKQKSRLTPLFPWARHVCRWISRFEGIGIRGWSRGVRRRRAQVARARMRRKKKKKVVDRVRGWAAGEKVFKGCVQSSESGESRAAARPVLVTAGSRLSWGSTSSKPIPSSQSFRFKAGT